MQVKDDGDLDQGSGSIFETSGQSPCILTAEARWSVTGLDVGCGKERSQ